ncbi:MAG TPA: hypothetical protein VEI07_20965, partial [Planctomycetaceae bacterium]|nr:hypothetical protein [Planctomycetaceae bacterium]
MPAHKPPATPTKAVEKSAPIAAPKPVETPPAKPPENVPTRPAAKQRSVGDPNDLEAFFDGALLVQLEAKHIAGAVVAVVVGDKLVFAKG